MFSAKKRQISKFYFQLLKTVEINIFEMLQNYEYFMQFLIKIYRLKKKYKNKNRSTSMNSAKKCRIQNCIFNCQKLSKCTFFQQNSRDGQKQQDRPQVADKIFLKLKNL
eukprot:TRINITY_DN5318_c1_g1_i1.p1 TRINITY_DN5318_c1_g1~~TRINITY_DN5318_c1_g1_i1.p1  ORF type:complete len:109 (-),score=10.32 TRINITY_DN5318_c1_g1_i1:55-381(-)